MFSFDFEVINEVFLFAYFVSIHIHLYPWCVYSHEHTDVYFAIFLLQVNITFFFCERCHRLTDSCFPLRRSGAVSGAELPSEAVHEFQED